MMPVLMGGVNVVIVGVVHGLVRLQEEVGLLLLQLLLLLLLLTRHGHGLLHHVHLVVEVQAGPGGVVGGVVGRGGGRRGAHPVVRLLGVGVDCERPLRVVPQSAAAAAAAPLAVGRPQVGVAESVFIFSVVVSAVNLTTGIVRAVNK